MPNWGEHLLIANKILKKVKIDENLFLFGNILPDVQDGYLVKGISNIVPHKINHYDIYDKFTLVKHKLGYENFYDIYKEKLNNPIIFGYLAHLMTDAFWNNSFYTKKCINENNESVGYITRSGELIKKPRLELRTDKQKEFEIFQNYIYQNYDMKLPEYSQKIVKNANIIETININQDDVKKVVEYIKETKNNSKNQNQETKIYKIEELEKLIDETVEFVLGKIK